MFLGILEVGFYIVSRMELALVKLITLQELTNDSIGTVFSSREPVVKYLPT